MKAVVILLFLACLSAGHRHRSILCHSRSVRVTVEGRVSASSPGAFNVTFFGPNATVVGPAVLSGSDGRFAAVVRLPRRDQLVYAVARRGEERLVAVLDKRRQGTRMQLVLSANTTVAAAYALAPFLVPHVSYGFQVVGGDVATRNAGMVAGIMSDSTNGDESQFFFQPQQQTTTTRRKMQHLAELVTRCNSAPAALACRELKANTARSIPFLALSRLAQSPGIALTTTFLVRDWTLPVVLTDTGREGFEFSGPGAISFDDEGNIYVTNNYVFGSGAQCSNGTEACPSTYVAMLNPDGTPREGLSPFFGQGQILGTGFGNSINRKTKNIWFGSFVDLSIAAFTGRGNKTVGFITEFDGKTFEFLRKIEGPIVDGLSMTAGVQGISSDANGNVFFNALTANRTLRIDAVTGQVTSVVHPQLINPFDLDLDDQGNVWVGGGNAYGNESYAVKLSNTLEVLLTVSLPAALPITNQPDFTGTFGKGVVVDHFNNVWIASLFARTVSAYTSEGIPLPGSPYNVSGAWGLSLDGDGNIYCAGFGDPGDVNGHFVAVICGANSPYCSPGEFLSRMPGWARGSNATERITDVQPASSGTVFALNNWVRQPTPADDPGGNGIVVFAGLARPPPNPIVLG